MAGFIGYISRGDGLTVERLLDLASCLNYLGQDSTGIAAVTAAGKLIRERAVGRLSVLQEQVKGKGLGEVQVQAALVHQRWATHGAPSVANAHPHLGANGQLAVVTSGIIENYRDLRVAAELSPDDLEGETDTEVLAKLLGRAYEERLVSDRSGPTNLLHRCLSDIWEKLVGDTLSVAAIATGQPYALAMATKSRPLHVALDGAGSFLACTQREFKMFQAAGMASRRLVVEPNKIMSFCPARVGL